ncbi:unnamed protein product [Phyllotreta striolata]|uniref:Lipase domain-containing protein n=1 Tax=Phyllotreta striolata TaxID=444603 RepID=A0A9N9XQP4_PHYSR|nr:unnamed protein product [Phyllotreta striolata]
MNIYVLLVTFFVGGFAYPDRLFREISPGVYQAEQISSPLPDLELAVKDNDVKIYFNDQKIYFNSQKPVLLNLSNSQEVLNKGYDDRKDTVFVIHGWHNEYDSPMCSTVSHAILNSKDVNVFIVDWSKIAKQNYFTARYSVAGVAKIVGRLIDDLIESNALQLNRTFFVGHSLGAHVAGICGAVLKGKVNHIVGLDPALPLFPWDEVDGRLDPTDAQFVQVIHTCSGILGYNRDLGHVDYWPNGGSDQPGCGGLLDIGGACSHSRSYKYFAESVMSDGFLSHKCDNYEDYENGKCDKEPTSPMGEYSPDYRATGRYFLQTHSESPFSQN